VTINPVGLVATARRGRFGLLRRPQLSPLARREARWGLLFTLPWIIGFLAFTFLPMVATLALTFVNFTLAQEEPLAFIGLDNYTRLLNDKQVWASLAVTIRFALIWLPISIVVPFAIALLLNSRFLIGQGLFRVLFFLPYVVPFVAGVLIWQLMLGDQGWINQVLMLVGVSDPPSWLFDADWVYPALTFAGIWGIGAGVIINLAGLRGIPTEYYDAARIDGAGALGQLRHVTIPMMSPVILYSLVLGVVGVMQYFLVPLVLYNGTGEPGGSTLFYNLYLYKNFFTFQQMSYGATLAWLLFGVTLLITLAIFWSSRRWVYYAGTR
jgi:ABC-type sugar transport system permease subunit